MKYYIIAGERSGDLHGSNLMKALAIKDTGAEFRYYGGDYMAAAGGKLVKHYHDIAIMGLVEVLKNLRKIKKYLNECKTDIVSYRPDVLILIDFAGFNMRIAKFAHKKNFRVFYYISPKVWAWNTSRAWKIKKYTDRMFVILPFEKEFYKKFNWEVDYIGNPVVDAVKNYQLDENFHPQLDTNKPIIAILPGSRKQEVELMLPVMKDVMTAFQGYQFLVAGVSSLSEDIYDIWEEKPENVFLYTDKTYEILSISTVAIVTSGTATLETALWNVPQVVGYITSPISYAIGSRLVRIKYFSLVNLIAEKEVVKEYLQKKCTPEVLSQELRKLVEDDSYRATVFSGYEKVKNILGDDPVSIKAAELIIGYLSK